ncbi:blood group Rh(CE) polypeptide isoform X2 [Erinaceus europaeus]|uniref:Blood group Rh(CE) polypeptide isoform X2 n=1 Tax=Erinaceus europaeus TaxID=9365 RepID=A0ABM3YKG8_ERIEU|nr:blood group Rh(CE) polypeptide isoform X2 [Erinaceus europaeus]
MGSQYPQSVRVYLPLWALTWEVAFILLFLFFTSYDTGPLDGRNLQRYHAVFQDVAVMGALGLGFFTSSLRRFGWSSVAFNLFMLALGVQWAVLLEGFLEKSFTVTGKILIKLSSIHQAAMSAMCVLISVGAFLGKANLLQLTLTTVVEVTAFEAVKTAFRHIFNMNQHESMMYIHVFAAYFGLTVAWCFSKSLPKGKEGKDQTATSSSLFAMLGSLFLWMFWPSFNSALLGSLDGRRKAVLNTYYALAVSAVTAISVSALARPQRRINMTHIHNAMLAGGVAVGTTCHVISSPWLAMILGLLAGLISIGGVKCLPVCLNRVLEIHDTCGLHYTFGLPGLLSGITSIMLKMYHVSWTNSPMFDLKTQNMQSTSCD